MTGARAGCIVEVSGLKVFAHHGVLAAEKEQGQQFVIDITLAMPAPEGDGIGSTVDYAWVASEAARVATSSRHDLIETVAREIAVALLSDERVTSASVKVSKPDAPMPVPVEDVSVTVTIDSDGAGEPQ
jgi:dihydroneopterin aldolase